MTITVAPAGLPATYLHIWRKSSPHCLVLGSDVAEVTGMFSPSNDTNVEIAEFLGSLFAKVPSEPQETTSAR